MLASPGVRQERVGGRPADADDSGARPERRHLAGTACSCRGRFSIHTPGKTQLKMQISIDWRQATDTGDHTWLKRGLAGRQ